MTDELDRPSFFARIAIAFGAFFRALGSAEYAAGARALASGADPAAERPLAGPEEKLETAAEKAALVNRSLSNVMLNFEEFRLFSRGMYPTTGKALRAEQAARSPCGRRPRRRRGSDKKSAQRAGTHSPRGTVPQGALGGRGVGNAQFRFGAVALSNQLSNANSNDSFDETSR